MSESLASPTPESSKVDHFGNSPGTTIRPQVRCKRNYNTSQLDFLSSKSRNSSVNFYSSPTPIPFENHDAQTLLTSQRAPGDVVKSPAPRRIGFHVDVNLLTCEAAGARSPSSDDHINVHDHNLVDVHDHVHDHGTVDSDHDHDRPEEQSENQDHSHREQDEIRRRDRLERQAQRASARRRRLERRAQRLAQFGLQRRRRAVTGPGALDAHHEYLDRGSTSLRLANRFGQSTSPDHDHADVP